MLYLREGWLVGNAGLGGALLVIAAAYTITGTTALAVSSIATNFRLRAGGAFAIISTALGLEAGGAIGIPLYLAQTISSVMYLYAFTEGYAYFFPDHPAWMVVGVAYVGVGAVVLASAALAARAQAVMLVVVALAIASGLGGWSTATPHTPQVIGRFADASLIECFALFFPAATGIMVGAGMSGSLARPTHSIPRGTMAAWGTTLVVYVLGAIWYSTVATPEELRANNLTMVDNALFGPLVLIGLLSSTLMASMSTLVAAPRLLQAMAAHRVVPAAEWLSVEADGEPRNATLVTLGLAGLGLLAGSLDAIAPIITSFFVMTYLAINVVVSIEQGLGLVSWRPRFAVPTWVPVLGTAACLAGLTLSSPAGGVPEVMFVIGIYGWLTHRRQQGMLETPWETVQSGIAQTVAAWAALRAARMEKSERTWKPDLLVPVATAEEARALAGVASAITRHRGSIKFVAVSADPALATTLEDIVSSMREAERFVSWHRMAEESPGQGARLSINAMQGTFFAPNLVLLSARHNTPAVLQDVSDHAKQAGVGLVLAFDTPGQALAPPRTTTVWLSDRSPDWALSLHVANLDLPVLLGYLLARPVRGRTRLVTVLRSESSRPGATAFLNDLIELGRLPATTPFILSGTLKDKLQNAPPCNIHVLGLSDVIDLQRLSALHRAAGAPCLFVRDSGQESALA